MDVRRESRLATREHAHRLADVAVARMRRDDGVAQHRGWVRAGDGGAEPVAGQRARHLAPTLPEVNDRVRHSMMHPGGDLHDGGVRLRRHVIAQIGRQVVEHLVRAERQRPVARIEEHELLLDPDRELVGLRAGLPLGPRREIDVPARVSRSRHSPLATSSRARRMWELVMGPRVAAAETPVNRGATLRFAAAAAATRPGGASESRCARARTRQHRPGGRTLCWRRRAALGARRRAGRDRRGG
jgi:hypothetical protein